MRLSWLTDIHLNFLNDIERRQFLESAEDRSDAVAVSGDIGESHDVAEYLREMDEVSASASLAPVDPDIQTKSASARHDRDVDRTYIESSVVGLCGR